MVPIIVKYKSSASDADKGAALKGVGGKLKHDLKQIRTQVIEVPSDQVAQALASYGKQAGVERAAAAVKMTKASTPNDPGYAQQWALPKIGWDQAYGSVNPTGSAKIAILDTGVDATHPDLAARMTAGVSEIGADPNTDPNGHGTEMAGIAAAAVNNGTGMAGVDYANASIAPVQVLHSDGTGYDSDVSSGVIWAADNGANVIEMAFSTPSYSATLADAVSYAESKGVVVVAATGNDGSTAATYPAGLPGVVGVASTDQNDGLSTSSNTASAAVAAPGEGIYATQVGGGYGTVSGTSPASAEVAGLAALLVANGDSVSQTSNQILGATDPVSGQPFGRINVARALGVAATPVATATSVGATPTPASTPPVYTAADSLTLTPGSGAPGDTVTVTSSASYTAGDTITIKFDDTAVSTLPNPCTVSANNKVNGSTGCTFTVPSGATIGTHTITAVSVQHPTQTLTASFQVNSGAASKIVFGQQPGNASAGASVSPAVTVKVEDASGNVVTNNTASITMAIGTNPSSGTLSGTTTVTAISGIATFSTLSIDKVGTGYTLVASTTGLTTNSVPSSTFDITPGAANRIAFGQQPTSAVATTALSPAVTVQVQDRFGNVVTSGTGSTASISMAIGTNPGSGTLGGTTSVPAVAGVATFNNLSINKLGSGYTLVASTTGLTTNSVTSNAFNITGTTKLAVTSVNSGANPTYGTSFSVVVQSQDANGNASSVVANTGVSLSVKTGTGTLGGTISGSIAAGQNSVTISGVTYSQAETGVVLTVSRTSGDTLTSGNSAAFTINKAPLTVTANNASRNYGDADPGFSSTITGFVNGETLATSGVTGSASCSSADAASSAAGTTIAITCTAGTLAATNYSFPTDHFVNGTLTINKAPLTVTANNATRNYGDPDPSFSSVISGFKNGQTLATSGVTGSPTCSTSSTSTSPAGSTWAITCTAGTLTAGNYSFPADHVVNGTLTIGARPVTVKAVDVSTTYGTPHGAYSIQLASGSAGLAGSDTLASLGTPTFTTTPASPLNVGVYPITVSGLTNANYAISYATGAAMGNLTIIPAVLTVTPTHADLTYGDAAPTTFSFNYTGFVGSDSAGNTTITGSPSGCSTVYQQGNGVGDYTIRCSSTGNLSAANYTFTLATGSLHVGGRAITVKALDVSTTYGTPHAAYGIALAGGTLGSGDTLASLGTPTFATNPVSPVNVGTYPITVSGLSNANYAINYATGAAMGNLTITPASLVITASSPSVNYNGTVPGVTPGYTGLVNGDTAPKTAPTCSAPTAPAGGAAGSYPTSCSGAADANYTISYQPGQLTISPVALTITAKDQSTTYGAISFDTSATSMTFSGFVNNEGPGVLGSGLTITSDVQSSSGTGSYTLTPGGAVDANYVITYKAGKLTVGQATLTVTTKPSTKVYGAANPAFAVGYSGFVNGDDAGKLGGTLGFDTSATSSSPVGSYDVTPKGLTSSNYTINFVAGQLAITPASLIIAANDNTRVYGSANPDFTQSGVGYIGFVNGDTAASLSGTLTYSTNATAGSDAGGSYYVRPSGVTSKNYTITFVDGKLSITQAPLTVKANDNSKTYGAASPDFTKSGVSYGGFVLGQDASVLGGTLAYSTTADASSPVGTYPITPSGLTSNNYAITFANGTLTVGQAQLTVTTNPATKVYGQDNPAFSVSYAGFVNNDDSSKLGGTLGFTTDATRTSPVGSYDVTPGGLTSSNYTITFVKGTLKVTSKDLTVTANDAGKIYGDANPVFSVAYSGFVNGDDASKLGGTLAFATTADKSSAAGTYAITPSGLTSSNYAITFKDGTLTVGPAPLTVTTDASTRAYGDANPSFTVSYAGFVNGDDASKLGGTLSFATSANKTSAVGGYDVTPGGLTSNNYAITFKAGTLTVTAATLTITADDRSRLYGAGNPTFTGSVTGQKNGETFNLTFSTSADATSAVGSYNIVPAVTGNTLSNYTVVAKNGKLTVTRAPLVVTPNDKTKVYGDANPVFDGTITGIQNGDTISATYGSTATAASVVGAYDITASLNDPGNKLGNYSVTLNKGTLTVTRKDLTVTAGDKTRTYGDANPAFSVSYSGFVNGDTETSLGGTLAFATSADASSPVGSYAITPSGLTSANYTIKFVDGTLSITKAALTITAADKSKVYGDANPGLTGTIVGIKNHDNITATYSTTADEKSNVGAYTITPTAVDSTPASLSNYDVTLVNGTLTVTNRPVTITADAQTKVYGAADPALTYKITSGNLVNGDTFTGALTRAVGETVGTYDITQGTVALSTNYTLSYVKAQLEITRADLLVTTDPQTRVYGDPNPTLTGTITGIRHSDNITASYSTTSDATSGVGTYHITATLADPDNRLGNYNITNAGNTLTVTKAPISVKADDQTKVYGDANPTFTGTITGIKNGDAITASYTTTADKTTGVGGYAIVPALSGDKLSNYQTPVTTNGTLTITAAPLTVTTSDATRVYGQENPAFSVGYSGFVNSDGASSLGGTLSYATNATRTSGAGTYAVTPSGLTSANYAITFKAGTLTVTKAPLTITALDQTSVYGTTTADLTNNAGTIKYGGFVNGDDASKLTAQAQLHTDATKASTVKDYAITVDSATSDNYSITFVAGTLHVTKAPLTVTALDQTTMYGTTAVDLTNNDKTIAYSGFVNGDAASSLTAQAVLHSTGDATSGVGAYDITVDTATSPNYAITFKGATLTIQQAPLTVTTDASTRVYGQANPTFSVSYSGFVNGDTASSLGGSLGFDTTATAASPVGSYDVTPRGLTSANYAITFVKGTLTVTKKDLMVTANDSSKTYGDANPTFSVSYAGFVNGDDATSLMGTLAYATTADKSSVVGTYTVTPSGLSSANYAIAFKDGTLTVNAAPLTVTTDAQTKVYGQMNPAFTGTITGIQNNDNITATYAAPADATSAVGAYHISATLADPDNKLGNYTVTNAGNTLTITPAPLTVKADDKSKVYGQDNPTLTGVVTGIENGDAITASYNTLADKTTGVGGYAIIPSLSGAALSNYQTPVITNGTLTVVRAALLVTTDAQTRVYGDANPTLTGTITGIQNGDTITASYSTDAAAASPVGPYHIAATLADSTNKLGNYDVTNAGNTLTVTKAPISVKADSFSRTYGDANPTFTGTIAGIKNGDAITASYVTVATQASVIGGYNIVPALSGDKLSNYQTPVITNGTLTVNAATLLVTTDAKSKVYGDANPAFTGGMTGIKNGDAITASYSTTADATSGVGTYHITATLADSGNKLGNYTVTNAGNTLTVTPKGLTITTNVAFKIYGQANPTFSVSYSGFVNGDTASSLGGSLGFDTTATAASPVGGYDVTPRGLTSSNYAITFVKGTLAVNPAALTITALNQSSVYGTTAADLTNNVNTISYTGFVNGDDASKLTTQAQLHTVAGTASAVGTYGITVDSATSPNYSITFKGGTLTVGPAALTITADGKSMTYGGTMPALTVTYNGLVNNDTPATFRTSPNVAPTPSTVSATSHQGSYPITVGGASDANYTISYKPGTLTINPAPLAITADNKSKVYGAALPALTVSYSGLVNGDTAATFAQSGNTAPAISTAATAASHLGNYTITASGAVDHDYTISYATGTLTVTPAALTITPNNLTMTYKGAVPTYTWTANWTNGDTSTSLATQPVCVAKDSSGNAVSSTTVAGIYTITCSGAADPDYTIGYAIAKLTIIYGTTGYLQPVNDTAHGETCGSPCPMSIFKAGQTIPFKFQLKDASGNLVGPDANPVSFTATAAGTTTQPVDESTLTVTPDTGTTFRWDGSQYIYNWKSPSTAGSLYLITATLANGQKIQVTIGLR